MCTGGKVSADHWSDFFLLLGPNWPLDILLFTEDVELGAETLEECPDTLLAVLFLLSVDSRLK